MKNGITQQQIDYVVAHINDRPRTTVARETGISLSSLYRIIREHGGLIIRELSVSPAHYRSTVEKHYPTMSAMEISRKFGIPKSTVIRWAERLHLSHTPETEQRLRGKCTQALKTCRTQESFLKAARKMRRHRTMERFRMLSGMPTVTRLKLSPLPKKAQKAVTRLIREYSYFNDIHAGGYFTLYYDSSTRRTPFEHLYTSRYRIVFRDAT